MRYDTRENRRLRGLQPLAAVRWLRSSLWVFGLACLLNVSPASADCVWEGKAPLCKGRCKAGFTLVKTDKEGDGKKCTTGTKQLCCPTDIIVTRGKAPFCQGSCKPGETRVGDSDVGENGQKCVTGKAAMCVNPVVD